MASNYASSGTVVTGSGANPVLSPTNPTSGPLYFNVLMIVYKSSSIAEPAVTSTARSWTRLGISKSGSVVASGSDTGSVSTLVYYNYGNAPTGTSVTFTGTVGSCSAVVFNYTRLSTEQWILASAAGSDDTVGANYSVTTTTSFHAGGADDVLVACSGVSSDAGTPSSPTMSATGLTIGTVTNRLLNASPTGDDLMMVVDDAPVPAGSQTDFLVYGYTNASSAQGSTLVIRLRVVDSPVLTVIPNDPFYLKAGYNVTVGGLTHYYKFRMYRDDSTGSAAADVRGGQLQLVGSNPTFSADDYEFSFGSVGTLNKDNDITYKLDVYDDKNVILFTATDVVNPYEDWVDSLEDEDVTVIAAAKTFLSVPNTPALDTPILIQEYNSFQRSGNVLSNSHVLGRQNPVINSDVMSGRTGSFKILVSSKLNDVSGGTGAATNVTTIQNLLNLGQVCMLRHIQPSAVGDEDVFFVVDSVNVERLNREANQAYDYESFEKVVSVFALEVSFIEVDRPDSTTAVSAFTWQSVLDSNTSWQAVLDSNTDWLMVLQTGGEGN